MLGSRWLINVDSCNINGISKLDRPTNGISTQVQVIAGVDIHDKKKRGTMFKFHSMNTDDRRWDGISIGYALDKPQRRATSPRLFGS